MQRWEYMVTTALEVEGMNAWGREGWELVTTLGLPRPQQRLYWKRPVQEASSIDNRHG